MNKLIAVIGLFILIVIAALVLVLVPAPGKVKAPTGDSVSSTPASLPDVITVDTPLPNASVSSPMGVTGKARGNWYFEASAPYQLKDATGQVIAQGHIDALGDWMTTDFVPFSAKITYPAQPAGSVGTLVLMNDNPSGLPENQKQLVIPVKF